MSDDPRNDYLHPLLMDTLQADRESLNDRWMLRSRAGVRIDQVSFFEHLKTTVNALIVAVADVLPERARVVVNTLFDVSLDLFAAGLLGPEARQPHVARLWREVLPISAKLLARDPQRVAGNLSNAVHHIASQASGRPDVWRDLLSGLIPECDSVSRLMDAGKVAAWRAGLVQHRDAALTTARELPASLAARCLGLSDDFAPQTISAILDRLAAEPWLTPESAASDSPRTTSLRCVAVTGAFRGFGGPCLRPPTVAAGDDHLFVTDGEQTWQLIADVFGSLWHRVAHRPQPSALRRSTVVLDPCGHVLWDDAFAQFDQLANASSFAFDGRTLAVTLPTSHRVFLVARTRVEPS